MSDFAAVEREPPELVGRNLRLGAQLWSSATAFFFLAFLFAYFYLRSLNTAKMWHPHHVKAPVTFGTVIMIVMVLSAVAAVLGYQRLKARQPAGWRTLGLVSLLLGLVVVILQIVEWSTIGFGPTDGGFASVFVGWTGIFTLFVFASLYWLETLWASSIRNGTDGDDALEPSAYGFAFYWTFLAFVGVVTWIVLYLL